MGFQMDDGYIDVAERIAEFRDKHPEGALQPWDKAKPYSIETIGDQLYIVVVAAAYRTKDDPLPGVGMAYEQFPGRTSFTRGSELQNAETSAWGRAIVAALAADTKRGVASAQEVRNRRAEDERPAPQQRTRAATNGPPSEADQARADLRNLLQSAGYQLTEAVDLFHSKGFGELKTSNNVKAIRGLIEHYRNLAGVSDA